MDTKQDTSWIKFERVVVDGDRHYRLLGFQCKGEFELPKQYFSITPWFYQDKEAISLAYEDSNSDIVCAHLHLGEVYSENEYSRYMYEINRAAFRLRDINIEINDIAENHKGEFVIKF